MANVPVVQAVPRFPTSLFLVVTTSGWKGLKANGIHLGRVTIEQGQEAFAHSPSTVGVPAILSTKAEAAHRES